jgi:uncharacterized protein
MNDDHREADIEKPTVLNNRKEDITQKYHIDKEGVLYLTANQLYQDSRELAKQVLDYVKEKELKLNAVIGVCRGGAPPAIVVHEFLKRSGIESKYLSIQTKLYEDDLDQIKKGVEVYGMDQIENLPNGHRLLIVDDVWDRGKTIEEIKKQATELNKDFEILVAVPYFKPGKNKVDDTPNFYVVEYNNWINFPHELIGLSEEQIKENLPEVYALLPKK